MCARYNRKSRTGRLKKASYTAERTFVRRSLRKGTGKNPGNPKSRGFARLPVVLLSVRVELPIPLVTFLAVHTVQNLVEVDVVACLVHRAGFIVQDIVPIVDIVDKPIHPPIGGRLPIPVDLAHDPPAAIHAFRRLSESFGTDSGIDAVRGPDIDEVRGLHYEFRSRSRDGRLIKHPFHRPRLRSDDQGEASHRFTVVRPIVDEKAVVRAGRLPLGDSLESPVYPRDPSWTSGVRAPLVNSSARLMINAGLTPFVAPFEQRSAAAGGTAGLSSSAHLRQTFRDSQPRPPLPRVCDWLCQCRGRVGAASSRWRTWGIVHGGVDVHWAEAEKRHWPRQWHTSTVPPRAIGRQGRPVRSSAFRRSSP